MRRLIAGSTFFFLCAFLASISQAANEQGFGYEAVTPAQPTANPDKIEVIEFFWYGCPHCYRLEPYLERWKKTKPDNVDYILIPAILRPEWELLARAYYVAQTLDIVDKTHRPLFDALHAERRRINDEQALEAFFAEFGVDTATFRKTYRSFAVQSKIKRARKLSQRYGVQGVPAIIVNGKYRTNGRLAGPNRRVIEVVNRLIKKENAGG